MKNLPRIACFHGGGSNAAIYEVQCAPLIAALENEYELVFFNGPYIRSAGPGVLPAFAEYPPFRSWFTQGEGGAELDDGSGYDSMSRDGVARVWQLMEAQGPGGEWVGAMGFSQGSRMAGGLLLDQQRRDRVGDIGVTDVNLRFGVCCMGAGTPMQSEIGHSLDEQTRVAERVGIRTLHVHGLKDIFLPLGRHQYETCYEKGTTTLFSVNYHHAMPWHKQDVQQLADHIRKIDKETRLG
ncbi:hypothetical protein FE257_000056 [Aspergillus nanangensis]|uniref:Serine hydrolase domain-containing protein n=1 Tax=Aspergillus nanangensis TaxID=2582783 RepID=A0AAD4GYQ7_ASPNN|nr:hypothetical protein FE257_000056 [Aspergillus nanangensis]